MANVQPLRILYDGHCPLCTGIANFLRRKDKRGKLLFTDLRGAAFDPREAGLDAEALEKQIHAVLPDGTALRGMAVIRAAFREVGLGWLAAPTGWPLLRPLFDALYGSIARHRRAIGRLLGWRRGGRRIAS